MTTKKKDRLDNQVEDTSTILSDLELHAQA